MKNDLVSLPLWSFLGLESIIRPDAGCINVGSLLRYAFTLVKIDLLVLDTAPQLFDEDIVDPANRWNQHR